MLYVNSYEYRFIYHRVTKKIKRVTLFETQHSLITMRNVIAVCHPAWRM